MTTDETPKSPKRRKGGPRDGLFKKGGHWWLDYYDAAGRRHREKAAPSYEVAKLILRDKLNAIAKGEVTGTRDDGLTFTKYVEGKYWPTVKTTLAPEWAVRSREILTAQIARFGGIRLSGLRREAIEAWYSERLGQVKASTAT